MNKFYLWIYLFALTTTSCRSDFEFGRAAFEEDLDIEDALRELMVSYDMSMSLSMSFSYYYGDAGSGGGGGGGSGSNEDDSNDQDGSGNGGGGLDVTSPTSTPTTASPQLPTPTVAPSSPPSTAGPAPTLSPTPVNTTTISPTADDDVVSVSLPSCFDFDATDFSAPIFVETSRDSISYALLSNLLTDRMRDLLPFCEDIQSGRMLEDGIDDSSYYIGNVYLVGDAFGATCSPLVTGNNCFVAELILKLFGNPTNEDVNDILNVVRELLKTDGMGEALGVENSLVGPLNNSTESDAGQGTGGPQASTGARQMSAGRKASISVVVIVIVAIASAFAYRRFQRGANDDEEGAALAATADGGASESIYGA